MVIISSCTCTSLYSYDVLSAHVRTKASTPAQGRHHIGRHHTSTHEASAAHPGLPDEPLDSSLMAAGPSATEAFPSDIAFPSNIAFRSS